MTQWTKRRATGVALCALCALAASGCPGDRPGGAAGADGVGAIAAGGDGSAGGGDGLVGGNGGGGDGQVCARASFPLSETQDLLTIPAGARFMHVKAWGAGGNHEGGCSEPDGGVGGYTEAVFSLGSAWPLSPGSSVIVIVGKRGRAGMSGEQRVKFGFGDWGGGGLSGVFSGPDAIDADSRDRALVIAGGGGSAGAPGCQPGGPGNHGSAGGQGSMQGGRGADDVNGGGGGYAGGSGGPKGQGALGGSGFVASWAKAQRLLSSKPGAPDPPNTTDADYDGSAGKNETSGRVVIHFVCSQPPIL